MQKIKTQKNLNELTNTEIMYGDVMLKTTNVDRLKRINKKNNKINNKKFKNLSEYNRNLINGGVKANTARLKNFFNTMDRQKSNFTIIFAALFCAIFLFIGFGVGMISYAQSFRGYVYIQAGANLELSVNKKGEVNRYTYLNNVAIENKKLLNMQNIKIETALSEVVKFSVTLQHIKQNDLNNLLVLTVNNSNKSHTKMDIDNYKTSIKKVLDVYRISAYVETNYLCEEMLITAKNNNIDSKIYAIVLDIFNLNCNLNVQELVAKSFTQLVSIYNAEYTASKNWN